MKRILVFSDSHDRLALCEKTIKNVPCDLILHAGDYARDAQELKKRFPDKELIYVRGNCDIHAYAQDDEIIELDGVRIFLTHGHKYAVKYEDSYRTLTAAARAKDCSVAVFGHTHEAYTDENDGVLLLNPGSARFSYGVIEIENGKPKACVIRDEAWSR